MIMCGVCPVPTPPSIKLKQSEEFEDNDDHDDYSNDIEDVPVHAGDSYHAKCVVASIYPRYMIP